MPLKRPLGQQSVELLAAPCRPNCGLAATDRAGETRTTGHRGGDGNTDAKSHSVFLGRIARRGRISPHSPGRDIAVGDKGSGDQRGAIYGPVRRQDPANAA